MDYNVAIYTEQGGERQVVASGGSLDIESGGELDIESGGALKIAGTAVTATAEEINRAADVSGRLVNLTAATLAITEALHDGKVITVNKADGATLTLPAATGSGTKIHVVVGTTITSSALVIAAAGDDTMKGLALGLDGDGVPANAWATVSDTDTITMDGTTQGGVVGDEAILIDIAADLWAVQLKLQQSETEATPFSGS